MRLIVGLLFCAALAGAQDLEEFAEQFEKAVEAGQLRTVLDYLPEEAANRLADEPAALHAFAATGSKWARKHAKGDADTWDRFVGMLTAACEAIPEENADRADVRAARGETLLCRARVDTALGKPFRKEDWTGAAGHFLALHKEAPGGGEHLERAVRILQEAGQVGGEDAEDLRQRADKLCLEGAEKFGRNRYFAQARHRAQLDQIAELVSKSPGRAKKAMKAYMDSLEEAGGSTEERNTLYNDAVTFARSHRKLSLKPKYRAERARIGIVEIDLPLSTRWKRKGSTIYQHDTAGELKRTISFDTYKWTTNYFLGRQKFGGDNLKGLARIGETNVLSVILNVKHRRNVRRGRLSRAISSAVMFEIGGLDEDGDYLCFRRYYFKAKETGLRSVKVSVLDIGEYDTLDPEAEFVIDSIREPRR